MLTGANALLVAITPQTLLNLSSNLVKSLIQFAILYHSIIRIDTLGLLGTLPIQVTTCTY